MTFFQESSCPLALGIFNMQRANFLERFNSKWVKSENGCHVWVKSKKGAGYGAMRFNGKDRLAHRIIWEITHGPIKDGLFVCHKCDNPACVNVDHLFLGTQSDNMRDMTQKNRHPYPLAEKHHRAKLTNEQVKEIRAAAESSKVLASIYGVTKRTILNVRHGYTYGSVA